MRQLDYVIITGDIANRSTAEEYKAAMKLIEPLMSQFRLNSRRIIIAPGNHDLNWDLSGEAYSYVPHHRVPEPLTDEYVQISNECVIKRNNELYKKRFNNFNTHFYKKIHKKDYPSEYSEQAVLSIHPDDKILFLSLNSSWNIDHIFTDNEGINMESISHALSQTAQGNYDDFLKIALWHHPVTGRESMNDEFLQLLAVHEFQICMHGHIHEAQEVFYNYDTKRGIHIIGAGTFGAPVKEQVSGIPLQYNLLEYNHDDRIITVKTRKKEKPDGAWSADARWGDKNNPKAWYTIELNHLKKKNAVGMSISFTQKSALVTALLQCDAMGNPYTRQTVVNELPDEIKNSLSRGNTSNDDVMNIVTTCLNFHEGLKVLIQIVRYFENNSLGMQEVDNVIRDFNL